MGIVYFFIGALIIGGILAGAECDGLCVIVVLGLISFGVFFYGTPHYDYETEVIKLEAYELLSLNEISDEYNENEYLLYDGVANHFIFYYKDDKGIIRQESLNTSSDYVNVIYKSKNSKYTIEQRDYVDKNKQHLFLNMFVPEYTLFLPEDGTIHSLIPEYVGD